MSPVSGNNEVTIKYDSSALYNSASYILGEDAGERGCSFQKDSAPHFVDAIKDPVYVYVLYKCISKCIRTQKWVPSFHIVSLRQET